MCGMYRDRNNALYIHTIGILALYVPGFVLKLPTSAVAVIESWERAICENEVGVKRREFVGISIMSMNRIDQSISSHELIWLSHWISANRRSAFFTKSVRAVRAVRAVRIDRSRPENTTNRTTRTCYFFQYAKRLRGREWKITWYSYCRIHFAKTWVRHTKSNSLRKIRLTRLLHHSSLRPWGKKKRTMTLLSQLPMRIMFWLACSVIIEGAKETNDDTRGAH